ncbi:hypothetical protein HYV49_00370 [Candidatus Pacearchaeota archaeon]|nr:hypothetical protein [Candidatus Pacearchaeota archaeon]
MEEKIKSMDELVQEVETSDPLGRARCLEKYLIYCENNAKNPKIRNVYSIIRAVLYRINPELVNQNPSSNYDENIILGED